ncbi:MAG: hypothetical protein ABIN01_08750 [Ferruginibacter sp.]
MQKYVDTIKEVKDLFSKRDTLNEEVDRKKMQKALDHSYDMWKFENDLYWKRATYFWGGLVVSFTAYFLLADSKFSDRPDLIMLVNSIGLVFSFGWYLVNRGSKYWQNNWLFIIGCLEEMLASPISGLKRKQKHPRYHPIGAYPFSVTKIHQIIACFITLIWVLLFVSFIVAHWDKSYLKKENVEAIILGILTIITLFVLFFGSLSNMKPPDVSFYVRTIINLLHEKERLIVSNGKTL